MYKLKVKPLVVLFIQSIDCPFMDLNDYTTGHRSKITEY